MSFTSRGQTEITFRLLSTTFRIRRFGGHHMSSAGPLLLKEMDIVAV